MARNVFVCLCVAFMILGGGCGGVYDLRGVVVDPNGVNGDLVTAARVFVGNDLPPVAAFDPAEMMDAVSAETDDDGRFSFESLAADRYDVLVFKPGHFTGSATARLLDGDLEIEIELRGFLWQIEVLGHELRAEVDAYTEGFVYRPDEGYQWLAVELAATNLARNGASLGGLFDRFALLDGEGLEYSRRLTFNRTADQLPESYNPRQRRTGFVYFEVPLEFDVVGSRLLVDLEDGPQDLELPLQ